MDCSTIRDEMLDVLYGEADAGARRRVAEHQARCEACRDEMASLKDLRRTLGAWKLPGRGGALLGALRLRGLAAAAALVIALGGALRLSGAEFSFERGPVALRLGQQGEPTRRLLAEQDARHRREIEALRKAIADVAARPERDVLLRVRELLQDSEQRQAQALSAALIDFRERAEAQRRYDLARISAGLSYLDGKTGQHVARTTELMGYMLQASEKK
jgi:anti-sigma factor RsiW